MLKRIIYLIIILFFAACSKPLDEYQGEYEHVFIYCGLGNNNLDSYLRQDIEELRDRSMVLAKDSKGNPILKPDGSYLYEEVFGNGSSIPGKYRDKAVLAFCHNKKLSPPALLRLYKEDKAIKIDTLIVYPKGTISASAETMHQVFSDIQRLFPSKRYGMLLSSHASGWLPAGYPISGERYYPYDYKGIYNTELSSFGVDNSSKQYEIDIVDLAKSIPFHLDYLLFDACMMSCAEVMWEFRNICDYVVASPTEILADGFVYKTLAWNLFSKSEADLIQICKEFFQLYDTQTKEDRSATITLAKMSGIQDLALAFAKIVSAHGLDNVDREKVQRYFYTKSRYFFFYDLKDLAINMGASQEELEELEQALKKCVVFHAETPYFFEGMYDNLALRSCCGLSVYLPFPTFDRLNSYYSTLEWNSVVGLLPKDL